MTVNMRHDFGANDPDDEEYSLPELEFELHEEAYPDEDDSLHEVFYRLERERSLGNDG